MNFLICIQTARDAIDQQMISKMSEGQRSQYGARGALAHRRELVWRVTAISRSTGDALHTAAHQEGDRYVIAVAVDRGLGDVLTSTEVAGCEYADPAACTHAFARDGAYLPCVFPANMNGMIESPHQ